MSWFARIFAHALARRVAVVIVGGLLAWFGMGRVYAADCESYVDQCTMAQAQAVISNWVSEQDTARGAFAGSPRKDGSWWWYDGRWTSPSGVYKSAVAPTSTCPDGSTTTTGHCGGCQAPEWEDPTTPGQCLSSLKCLSRNVDLGSNAGDARPSLATSRCVAGCKFGMVGPYTTDTNNVSGVGSRTVYRGVMEYTGDQCGVSPIDPVWDQNKVKEQPPQECTGGPALQVCVKKSGERCVTSKSGRQICWGPNETGQKTDNDVLQKRDAGPNEIPPNPTIPTGDTLNKVGQSVTNTTTNNTTNSIVTTTTTNYITTYGTKPPGDGAGEKGDGSGDDKSSGSTSSNCEQAPQCQGDAIDCAMLRQGWINHCNGATQWGKPGGDLLSTSQLDEELDPNAVAGLFENEEDGIDAGLQLVDDDGWAGRGQCPIDQTFSMGGRTHSFADSNLCELLDALAALIGIIAIIHAGWIIAGGRR